MPKQGDRVKPALAPVFLAFAGLLGTAAAAGAELAPWDPPKVTDLARQLEVATRQLYDTFEKLPPLEKGSQHTRTYFRLKQEVRHMKREARWLARALEKNLGQEETLPSFESLRAAMRGARQDAGNVQTSSEFQQNADAVEMLLDRLAPYYDPTAKPPAP
jgi:hypothetical protein